MLSLKKTSEPAIKDLSRKQLIALSAIPSLALELLIEILGRHSVLDGFAFLFQHPLVFLFNASLIYISLIFALFFQRKQFVLALIGAFWVSLGVANAILLIYRITPLSAMDFVLLHAVGSILPLYFGVPQLILTAFGAAVVVVILVLAYRRCPRSPNRAALALVMLSIAIAAATLSGCAMRACGVLGTSFTNLGAAYRSFGFPYSFTVSLFDRGIDKPPDYSEASVDEILAAIDADQTVEPEQTPNIIFLQLESFFDPNYVHGLQFSENPIPIFTALRQGHPHGYLTVPVIGGGTANTEFEILTAMNLEYFGTGEYPYNTVLQKEACESMAYDLHDLGYATHAIHSNSGTFYSRNFVFSHLGFDSFTSLEYMNPVEFNPLGWAKDRVLIPEIDKALDATKSRDFIYTITVQGHGKYPTTVVDPTQRITVDGLQNEANRIPFEYYVNQLHETDVFIGELLADLNGRHEPSVVVMYGDHLPNFELDDASVQMDTVYETEYVIWSNFGLTADNVNLRSYQLSSYVMGLLGMDSGVLTKLHQRYQDNDNYQQALKLLEYDMLYGDHEVRQAHKYTPTVLQMGIDPILITGFSHMLDYMYIYGDNFTPWSTVYRNGDDLPTTYISSSCLRIDETKLRSGDHLTVSQVGSDAVILSTSNTHLVSEDELLDLLN
ncbi:MAG: sulfatase-like hydrolase/transferase [Oscillospiraceae bacterium]|nr:sulfatase-like hydrolase/transferase [Oscillospiraceae bacterium]